MSAGKVAVGATAAADAGPRRRPRTPVDLDEVVRGASAAALAQPAGDFLDAMSWAGPSPDPDVLDAATFLAWL
jgi:hypothetical protein